MRIIGVLTIAISLSFFGGAAVALAEDDPDMKSAEEVSQELSFSSSDFDLSDSYKVYTFSDQDRATGYTINGQSVEGGSTKILVQRTTFDAADSAASGKRCDGSRCVVGGSGIHCSSHDDCQFKRCDIASKLCIAARIGDGMSCIADTDCKKKDSMTCNPGSGKCRIGGRGVGCTSDSDCLTKSCDLYKPMKCLSGALGSPCSADSDCPSKVCYLKDPGAPICVAIGSAPPNELSGIICNSDSDCLTLKKCGADGKCGVSTTGDAAPLCNSDSDCDRKKCDKDKCVTVGPNPDPHRRPCSTSADCEMKRCAVLACQPGGTGTQCNANAGCN